MEVSLLESIVWCVVLFVGWMILMIKVVIPLAYRILIEVLAGWFVIGKDIVSDVKDRVRE